MSEASRIKQAFCLFDRNGDGLMTCHEFPVALRSLGWNPSEKEISELTKDKPEVNFDEFSKIATGKVKPKDEMLKELTVAFKTFDRDNSGCISSSELKHVLLNLGERLQATDIDRLIAEADPTDSGKIKYADFSKTLIGV